jgi:hypothetical protein
MSIVRFWAFVAGIVFYFNATAQTFENIRTRVEDDRVIIFYDLVTFDPGSKVRVRVYSSHDYFEKPLQNVSGDIGLVVPGPNRRIVWQPGELLEKAPSLTFNFQGDMIYDLRILKPEPSETIIRGKGHSIEWQGGHPDDTVVIVLKDLNRDSVVLAQTKNSGSYVWETPKDLKPGKNYSIKISTSDVIFVEQRFAVRRKIPLVTWGIPILGVATFVIIKATAPEEEKPLPDAPDPG